MSNTQPTFVGLTLKTIVVHTVTYFLVGLTALTLFDYSARFAEPPLVYFMRPTSDPVVALGVALQPIRGVLFALAFYPLREILFGRPNGWLITWLLLVALGIFSTFGPAPGSVEGVIYTTLPIREQFSGGMLEVLTQSFLLASVLYYWVNHPRKRWLNWGMGVLFVLVLLMSIMGFVVAQQG
jgi:hypothetical protein